MHALKAGWDANFEETERFVGAILVPATEREIRASVARWLAAHETLLDDRIASGTVCDGHGDLQAEDIFCLDDGVRILDCLEFSDQLRYGDVCADVAFLAMDLERLGRPDAASNSSSTTSPKQGSPSRGRYCTTTSLSGRTCGPRWHVCGSHRGARGAIRRHGGCRRWPCGTQQRGRFWCS